MHAETVLQQFTLYKYSLKSTYSRLVLLQSGDTEKFIKRDKLCEHNSL